MKKTTLDMWLRMPETQEFVHRLTSGLDQIIEITLDRNMLKHPNAMAEYSRMVGMSEGIKYALDFDALIEEDRDV